MPPFLFCLSFLSYHRVHVNPSLCWLHSQSPMIKKSSAELVLQMQAIASCSDWSFESETLMNGALQAHTVFTVMSCIIRDVCVCVQICACTTCILLVYVCVFVPSVLIMGF